MQTIHPVRNDQRWRVSQVWRGYAKPVWVAYFCDEEIGWSQFKGSAILKAVCHNQAHNGALTVTGA